MLTTLPIQSWSNVHVLVVLTPTRCSELLGWTVSCTDNRVSWLTLAAQLSELAG